VLHEGVRHVYNELRTLADKNEFAVAFVEGGARSGKTHLGVKLCDELIASGHAPIMIDGAGLSTRISDYLVTAENNALSGRDVVIVDDIHLFLAALSPEQSGPFVGFYERLRAENALLILLSSVPLGDYTADEHTMSRLRQGHGLSIGSPNEEDLEGLLKQMARQRGMVLNQRNLKFLLRRLRRDVASLENYLDRLLHLTTVLGAPVRLSLVSDAMP
jgi:DnaA family protein